MNMSWLSEVYGSDARARARERARTPTTLTRCGTLDIARSHIYDLCAYIDKIWPCDGGKAGLKINLGAFMFADNPDFIKISNQED